MMARKFWTKNFINILKTNLVSRPKYGISTMVIPKALIQTSQTGKLSMELACIWYQMGTAIIHNISHSKSCVSPYFIFQKFRNSELIVVWNVWMEVVDVSDSSCITEFFKTFVLNQIIVIPEKIVTNKIQTIPIELELIS